MHWLALLPPDGELAAWRWRALQFTPRVAQVDEALVLELAASLRLWGGAERLLRRFLGRYGRLAGIEHAQGATSFVALALLRLKIQGAPLPQAVPDGLPLATLSAARPHLDTLARTGCRTWGQLRALPRAGVARRFGAALLRALDAAYGEQPENHVWLSLPEVFDQRLELPMLATTAPELMHAAQRLLGELQAWLRASQRGVLALELEWTLDLRRLDGIDLPEREQLTLRTAEPTQGMAHLRRLMGEHLARARLAAPANQLRLRTLETAPWAGSTLSLLMEEQRQGERLHELVERLSARLGPEQVRVPRIQADHRPECMQRWVPARGASTAPSASAASHAQALYPAWLLSAPLRLQVQGDKPHYHGPLQLLSRAQRLETGWWGETVPAFRDYFIARSDSAGLLWIYRERPLLSETSERWFLHGIYA